MDATSYLLGKKAGGGSGTTDYDALTNKPSINGVTLSGNKTSEDLGIEVPTIPEDLLHYKGHVGSEADLPSTGQPSGVQTAHDTYLDGTNLVKSDSVNAVDKANEIKGSNLYIFGQFSDTISDIQNYKAIVTNHAEIIDKIYVSSENFTEGALSPSSFINICLVHISASSEKPAYLYSNSKFDDENRFSVIEYDDGTQEISSSRTALTITKSGWFNMYNYNRQFVGNLPHDLRWYPHWTTHSETYYSANTSGQIVEKIMPGYRMAQSITVHTDTPNFRYVYNEGYKFLSFAPTVEVVSFFDNNTIVLENDTYTVGDTYEIYRANALPAWEHWSKQLDLTSINGYDATKTQTLKNVNGTIEWVNET